MSIEDKIVDVARNLFDLPIGRFKHFSFICNRNKIVSVGWNKAFKTHPLAKRFGHRFNCIHSELDAITSFNHPVSSLHKYKFYNVRLRTNGKLAVAKPCLHCQYMLSSFGVEKVWYSSPTGFKEF